MAAVAGYSYRAFCQGIAERDGAECYVRKLLIARRAALQEKWAGGQADGTDPLCHREWVPLKLLDCDGQLDGHHVLGKSWIKGHERSMRAQWLVPFNLAAVLNDPRNGILACRRHHDLLERHLITVRREDLPSTVEEFAAELGDRALARLERDYGLRTEAA